MQDREPTYPGRVTLTPVYGLANTYDMERADRPLQEGTPLNKASLLQDVVCDILGLDYAATPNDAFMSLALPSGKYAISVTLKSPGGRLMQGVALSGIVTAAGNPVVTNSNGVGFGFATTSPVTVTADISAFLDLTGTASVTVTPTAGVVNKAEITCTRASSAQTTISTSKTVRFSPDVSEYDFSAIGGGYNGGTGTGWTNGEDDESSATGGNGGRAGGVVNKSGNANTGENISVIVGGIGGTSKVGAVTTPSGAAGGKGAHTEITYINGSLEGSGYNGTAGGDTGSFLYPPTSVGGAGGGGGANAIDSGAVSKQGGRGGSPGGGAGGYSPSHSGDDGKDGTRPGAGGGGACGRTNDRDPTGAAGKGKPGLVGFMWRYAA